MWHTEIEILFDELTEQVGKIEQSPYFGITYELKNMLFILEHDFIQELITDYGIIYPYL